MKSPAIPLLACAALVATSVGLSVPAAASSHDGQSISPGTPTDIAEGLLSPLSLEVGRQGVVYVSQNFPGLLTQVNPDGSKSDIVSAPGDEIGAVSYRRGVVYYAQNSQDLSSTLLKARNADGSTKTLADLGSYEASNNPDKVNTYGFVGLPADCAAQIGDAAASRAEYTGLVDSHPYATFPNGSGVYVADAGANAILRVRYDGSISTVAVLPPTAPVVVTAEQAAEAGFPDCTVGYGYRFEPVPTDVEWGSDGRLYVTSLPGGPEDPSLGARGSVYRVNPRSGKVELVATGFAGATGLAVSRTDGTIFVAELFGVDKNGKNTGRVSVVEPGESTPQPFADLSSPAAIELRHNKLYVTTNSFVPGENGAPLPIGKVTVVPLESDHEEDSMGG